MNEYTTVDLRTERVHHDYITFVGNDEKVVIDVVVFRMMRDAIGKDEKIKLIRCLRCVRMNDKTLSLKLAKDIVEWFAAHID